MAWTAPASVEDGTLLHNRTQQSAACSGAPPTVAGRAQTRQAQRAAPSARRCEGSKPNGRDGIAGTGRSPRARRRSAPTRHPVQGVGRTLCGLSLHLDGDMRQLVNMREECLVMGRFLRFLGNQ